MTVIIYMDVLKNCLFKKLQKHILIKVYIMGWKKRLREECLVRMYIFVYTHLFLYFKNIRYLHIFWSLLTHSKYSNISLALKNNFVSSPSYYNNTACVYCEGWD